MRPAALEGFPTPPFSSERWPWAVPSLAALQKTYSAKDIWPRITIVTPSFNQGEYIEETIRSVLSQGYPNLEYIVMDGGSTDHSVSIIRKYAPWLSYWHSAPDLGQADALNRALNRATGLWFHNVNSDDVLAEGALAQIGNQPETADCVVGPVVNFEGISESVVHNIGLSTCNLISNLSPSRTVSWHQPGVIMKTKNLRAIGGYPVAYRCVFDFYTTCRYLEIFSNQVRVERPLVRFRLHASQKTANWDETLTQETICVRNQLAQDLYGAELRSLARFSAARISFRSALAKVLLPGATDDDFVSVLRIVRTQPKLLLNRMFLGSVRRRPGTYLRLLGSL